MIRKLPTSSHQNIHNTIWVYAMVAIHWEKSTSAGTLVIICHGVALNYWQTNAAVH